MKPLLAGALALALTACGGSDKPEQKTETETELTPGTKLCLELSFASDTLWSQERLLDCIIRMNT